MTSLSKSKILLHRQCPKRLWLSIHHPGLAKVNAATQSRLSEGNKVGDIARQNYPDGVFIDTLSRTAALELTKDAIQNKRVIFEAAFFEDNVVIRADLLIPEGDSYCLVEVKSSTSVKDYHLEDATVQAWVMAKAGIMPKKVFLAHIDNQFVYLGDGNYTELFVEKDISSEVQKRLPNVQSWVDGANKTISLKSEPSEPTGERCTQPFVCDFYEYCNPPEVDVLYPVEILPYGKKKAEELRLKGFRDLRDVPAEMLSNPKHLRVHESTVTGYPYLDPLAVKLIKALPYPRYYLDFETIAFAVPIWSGTRPYMQVPFQWSCHIESRDGALQHKEFLDLSGEDPRREFAESLIKTVGDRGPVIVYNAGFEGARIRELASIFPDISVQLLDVVERFFDLLPLAREHYYHPKMMGSWSIKDLLPTVAPELEYSNLVVSDGSMAQEAYKEAIDPEISKDKKENIRSQMLEYCSMDTMAMVRILNSWSS